MRAQLTKTQESHPKSCKERLITDRKGGDLIDIHSLHAGQIQILRQYFHKKTKQFTQSDNINRQRLHPAKPIRAKPRTRHITGMSSYKVKQKHGPKNTYIENIATQ